MTSKVVGILGGTFDPIHCGHLRLAQEVAEALVLVQVRFIPGGTPPHRAQPHTPAAERVAMVKAIESLTLDRGAAHLKDELAPRYAELIYNGFWFSPEREMMQAAIDHSQARVDGTVRLKLYKGSCSVIGRKSPQSLYSEKVVTFEDDQGAYDQRDAEGFIKLNALRLRLLGRRDR